jgi:hypothetical protein
MGVAGLSCLVAWFVTAGSLADDFAVVFAVVGSHDVSKIVANANAKMIMKRHIWGMSSNEKAER